MTRSSDFNVLPLQWPLAWAHIHIEDHPNPNAAYVPIVTRGVRLFVANWHPWCADDAIRFWVVTCPSCF